MCAISVRDFLERLRNPKTLALIAVIPVMLIFLYARALTNEFVEWDDGLLIVNNPIVHSFSLKGIWNAFTHYDPELYIPLTFVSYQINYAIGGLNPFLYHATNLLLHCISAFLIGGIAYFLSKKNIWIACAAALLFAIHPIHTEAVLWASARKDVLAGAFALASFLLHLMYRESEKRSTYFWSLFTFLLALLSKISVVTLPLLFLLNDWRMGRKRTKKDIIEIIPSLALSVVFGIVALRGKHEQIAHLSVGQTVLMAIKSFAFAIEKLFLPLHLSPLYPYTDAITLVSPHFYLPALFLVALCAIALWSLRYSRDGLFLLLFFFLALLPSTTNFLRGEGGDVYVASDRYAYVASFAAIFLVCALFFRLKEKYSPNQIQSIFGIMIAALCVLTFNQTKIWKNNETLFTSVIAQYPNAQAAHHNLGVMYQRRGQRAEALHEYALALAISPKASTESNIGDILRENGQTADAMTHYQKALAIYPRSVDAILGIGLLHMQANETDLAIAQFLSAVELAPDQTRTHIDLGAAYMKAGKTENAIGEYERAIAIDETSANAHFNLGSAYKRIGNIEAAKREYERALMLEPDNKIFQQMVQTN